MWYKAKMTKTYKNENGWTNPSYSKGRTVYIDGTAYENSKGETTFCIFCGNHHITDIRLTIAQAKEMVKTERRDGKLVPAKDQEDIQFQYEWMLDT